MRRTGFVVAAPVFPLTSRQATFETVGDYVNQPADVSFVIDRILARSDDHDGPLAGRVDEEHIGLTELSLGGATVYGIALDSCCRDRRVDAALVMAGLLLPYDGAYEFPAVPLLIIHGNGDARALRPNRVFVPEIGERLFISRATVKTHLPHMLDKLSVADRAELATFPNAQLAKRAI
jgi:hypothetical protein